jgi:hypothetical protein
VAAGPKSVSVEEGVCRGGGRRRVKKKNLVTVKGYACEAYGSDNDGFILTPRGRRWRRRRRNFICIE